MTLTEFEQRAFDSACQRAQEASLKDHCTIHVNASVIRKGAVWHVDFTYSDWYVDGSTINSYTDGHYHD